MKKIILLFVFIILNACAINIDYKEFMKNQAYCEGKSQKHAIGCEYIEKNLSLVKKDCNNNIGFACISLGYVYRDLDSYKNISLALEYFEKGCDLGVGCNHLGTIFYNQINNTDDLNLKIEYKEKAIKYYEIACKNGRTDACLALEDKNLK